MSRAIRDVARLDFADIVRSRWLVLALVVYGVLAAIFVLVGMRESAVMQFTGMSRVLLNFTHALVLLLPLIALASTGQVINAAREDGTLELVLAQPISRTAYFVAISLARYLTLLVPLALLMLAMALFGRLYFGQAVDWRFVAWSVLVGAALLACFVGLGLALSVTVRNQGRALIGSLILWAAVVALLDFALIGLMLQWRLNHQTVLLLASVNPVQTSRLALLMAADPELAWLGPVGIWLTHHLGQRPVMVLGIMWPLALGLAAWTWALLRFRRCDVV